MMQEHCFTEIFIIVVWLFWYNNWMSTSNTMIHYPSVTLMPCHQLLKGYSVVPWKGIDSLTNLPCCGISYTVGTPWWWSFLSMLSTTSDTPIILQCAESYHRICDNMSTQFLHPTLSSSWNWRKYHSSVLIKMLCVLSFLRIDMEISLLPSPQLSSYLHQLSVFKWSWNRLQWGECTSACQLTWCRYYTERPLNYLLNMWTPLISKWTISSWG